MVTMQTMEREKIAFYQEVLFHDAIMIPILREVEEKFDCLLSNNIEEIIDYDPAAVFLASKCNKRLRRSLPNAYFIWTRHGFSSKNWAWRSIRVCDIACVSSEWVKQEFIRRGHLPKLGFWVTGYPPMDSFYRNMKTDVIPEKGKTILYAPTFDENLSAFPVIGTSWIQQVLQEIPEIEIFVKLHPHTVDHHPRWIDEIDDISRGNPQMTVLDPQSDIYKIMHRADILISDVSSVIFFFLALNRPIILVSNQNRFKEKKYDPQGPESCWRDLGIEVYHPEEILPTLKRCMADPTIKQEERQQYRERVFGDKFDGLSSRRIAAKLYELLYDPQDQSLEIKQMKKRKTRYASFGQAWIKLRAAIRGQA